MLFAPLIPAINDHEWKGARSGWAAGAETAGYVLRTSATELRALFEDWLVAHYPDRRPLSAAPANRGWGTQRQPLRPPDAGEGVFADLYSQRLRCCCERSGSPATAVELVTTAFRPPGRDDGQLALF